MASGANRLKNNKAASGLAKAAKGKLKNANTAAGVATKNGAPAMCTDMTQGLAPGMHKRC